MLKRILITAAAVLAAAVIFCPAARAESTETALGRELGTEELQNALPESAEEALGGLPVSAGLRPDELLGRLGERARSAAGNALGGAVKNAAAMFVAALVCSAAAPLTQKSEYVTLAGVLAVACLAAADTPSLVSLGRETVDELCTFSRALLPTLAASAAAGGAVTSAAAKYAAAAMFMDILMTAAEKLVIPLVCAYIAAGVGAAALGGESLSGAASLIKWLACAILTCIALSFTVYLSVTGVVTGSADAAAIRTAKTAVAAVLPVVGGIMSDAAGAVLAGADAVRGAAGAFGLAAVCAVCILPVMRLGAGFLVYKAAAAAVCAVADGRIAKLTGTLGTAFGILLGTVGTAAVMLFISIISFMKAVA